jgi:hypothetical protein
MFYSVYKFLVFKVDFPILLGLLVLGACATRKAEQLYAIYETRIESMPDVYHESVFQAYPTGLQSFENYSHSRREKNKSQTTLTIRWYAHKLSAMRLISGQFSAQFGAQTELNSDLLSYYSDMDTENLLEEQQKLLDAYIRINSIIVEMAELSKGKNLPENFEREFNDFKTAHKILKDQKRLWSFFQNNKITPSEPKLERVGLYPCRRINYLVAEKIALSICFSHAEDLGISQNDFKEFLAFHLGSQYAQSQIINLPKTSVLNLPSDLIPVQTIIFGDDGLKHSEMRIKNLGKLPFDAVKYFRDNADLDDTRRWTNRATPLRQTIAEVLAQAEKGIETLELNLKSLKEKKDQ